MAGRVIRAASVEAGRATAGVDGGPEVLPARSAVLHRAIAGEPGPWPGWTGRGGGRR